MIKEKDRNEVWIEPYWKHPKYMVLCIPVSGGRAPFKFGFFKAQAILQHLSDIEEFVQMEREKRDPEWKTKGLDASDKESYRQIKLDDQEEMQDTPERSDDLKNKIMRLTKTQCEYNDSFQKGWRENLSKDGWMLVVLPDVIEK